MLTQAQLKGKIKSLAKNKNADARILMRLYMMERFLERISRSPYADDFVIKGGILVTSMLGIAQRSTMDIDTSIRNFNLTENDALQIVKEIGEIIWTMGLHLRSNMQNGSWMTWSIREFDWLQMPSQMG